MFRHSGIITRLMIGFPIIISAADSLLITRGVTRSLSCALPTTGLPAGNGAEKAQIDPARTADVARGGR